MLLRMVFEPQDLQQVRLAGDADPMWEMVLGLQKAQRNVPAPFARWHQDVRHRLTEDISRAVWPLSYLVGPLGGFPDFLTPDELTTDFDAGCAAVACTSRARVVTDLASTFRGRTATTWVRTLATGDRDAVGDMTRAARVAHDLLVAPHWTEMREVVAADRAQRARVVATDGVGALLTGIPGVLGWDGRVLLLRYPEDRTVHLRGRGLTLLPSYFCWGSPVTWINPELPPLLVYQAGGPDTRPVADVAVPGRLVSLLGRTRAECLRLLLVPLSTSDLAEHLGTSVGNASKQATVLRNAGLITSTRHGPTVLHTTTALGVALLTGTAPGP